MAHATLTKRIFGTEVKIKFDGDDQDEYGFKILSAEWDKSKYSDFQNILFKEWIQTNEEKLEEEINNPEYEI